MTCNKTILFVGVLMTYFVDDPRSGSRCVRVVLCEAASAASAASNDEQSDDSLLSEIASAQAEVGDVDGAMSTTDKIGDLEQRGSTLFSVSVAALAVNFAEARRVADRIKPEYDLYGNDYRASAYSRMGEAEAERGNLQEARDIAEAIKQGWGPKQAYFVLWEVATFQWRAGHEQESLRTLEEIGADAEDKIRVIVSAALREAEVGENQRAKLFLVEATKATDESQVGPRTLREIANAQADIGDISGARQTIAKLIDQKEKESFLGWLAMGQLRRGNADITSELVLEIRSSRGKDPILRRVALARAKTGDLRGARELAKLIQSHGYRALASADLAQQEWARGDRCAAAVGFQMARQFAEQADRPGEPLSQSDLFVRIAIAQGKCCLASESRTSFQRAIRIILNKRSDTSVWGPESRVYWEFRNNPLLNVIAGQAEVCEIQGALNTCRFLDGNYADNGLSAIAAVLTKKKDFKQAIFLAGGIKDHSLKGYLFRQIAEAWVRTGEAKSALSWACGQCSPMLKANALLGIAQGLMPEKPKREAEDLDLAGDIHAP